MVVVVRKVRGRKMTGKAKWDWDEARRLGAEVGRSPKTIVDCWREGRPIAPEASKYAKKTEHIDMCLQVFRAVFNGFPQPRTSIAEVCGVSAEAIRNIENKALRKMREKSDEIKREWRESA